MTQTGLPLSLQRIAKKFGTRTVIHDLDLDIAAGEFIAVVGRSGCGKSTLLRLLAQLDDFSDGVLMSDELTAADLQSRTRLMFQEARLLPWKTVLGNVGFGLSGHWRERALQVLAEVGLADRAHDWPSALSGGQRQRVALARALIHRPQLLLLDEPLGALDALTRLEMQQLIVRLWQQHRFTVILVTHDVSEAVLTANRVLLIEGGKIDLDVPIRLPHPRINVVTETAPLEQMILDRILHLPRYDVGFSI
ncbi:ATP-binding cassette domain-containing protein [Stenoxybacter acetivorans]|uniref:ATP-binding cassette domain-containing protein n=1 Tax=Stenoxybacter acetivorans TaxID=422441 RepID=UPI0005671565|nr:ATP-binding cassette domain-containing protein [Stenoxybacter acetivorans]